MQLLRWQDNIFQIACIFFPIDSLTSSKLSFPALNFRGLNVDGPKIVRRFSKLFTQTPIATFTMSSFNFDVC